MRRRVGAAAALAVAVSLAGYLAFGLRSGDTALVASGTVEATTADVGFAVAGRIQELLVREGEPVTRGQLLARLDAADLEARAETMRAQAAAARAALAEVEAGARTEEVAQARAGVRAAVRRLDDAGRDLDRALRLFEGGAISRESLDRAESVHDLAEAAVDQARQHLAILESGARPERIAAQRAGLEAAEAAARQAEVALDHASIRAPFDGRVTIRHREPGETVQPGQPVVTVTDPTDRWVRIFIPETRMGAVALGQDASIESDTFRGRAYAGRVTFIATEAEFTPRSIQTREERVKLVFAARVQIVGDTALELKPGMPADVRLHPSGLDGRPGI
jgi:HlyD family secretion protein